MKILELKAVKREKDAAGNFLKDSKQLRREGQVPCVVYGGGDNISFSVDAKDLKPLIYTPNSFIVEFDIDGKKEKAVLRETQFHPVKDEVLHVDFYRVIAGKPIAIDVPVKLEGIAEGVKQGGKLSLSKRKLRVLALEENLPDELKIDVSGLELGKSIFVNDIHIDGLQILTPGTTAVCAVRMTRAARGAAAAAAAATGKKK